MVGAFSHKYSLAPSGKTTDRIKKLGDAKMGRTSSIIVPSIVVIVGRAPAVDEKVLFFCLLPAGLRVALAQLRIHAGFVFTQLSKNWFFAPINVKFGMGSALKVRYPMPNFTFIGAKMWEYSPRTVKISNFGHKFAPQGRLVCTIFKKFSAFVCVYIGSF